MVGRIGCPLDLCLGSFAHEVVEDVVVEIELAVDSEQATLFLRELGDFEAEIVDFALNLGDVVLNHFLVALDAGQEGVSRDVEFGVDGLVHWVALFAVCVAVDLLFGVEREDFVEEFRYDGALRGECGRCDIAFEDSL